MCKTVFECRSLKLSQSSVSSFLAHTHVYMCVYVHIWYCELGKYVVSHKWNIAREFCRWKVWRNFSTTEAANDEKAWNKICSISPLCPAPQISVPNIETNFMTISSADNRDWFDVQPHTYDSIRFETMDKIWDLLDENEYRVFRWGCVYN